nr:RecName: Full=Acidic phospholipase A2 4; Short=svPLA2; AltName: Full=PLA2-IV; AltName: Full=Phosphatidylcholine 2-acylhydrolase [Trimeresurus stejnegeri]
NLMQFELLIMKVAGRSGIVWYSDY